MQVGSRKEDQVENQQYQQDKRQQGKEEQHEVREESQVATLVTSILPQKCVHEVREDYSFLIDQSVMLIGNSHTFEEDNCQQMEDVHANADMMVEFCHFKWTSKQMSKEDVKTAKQQLQRQGPKNDSNIMEEIRDDDVHIGIDKASQILEDAKCDSDSNSNFNLDSVSILDLDSTAILDAKINSDANFNGSCEKLDEVWMLQKAKDIAANDEVVFGNADGVELFHGNCQAICQVGNQADDRLELMMYDVPRIQHNQRSVDQVLDHGKVKRRIQEDFQELARGMYDLIFLIGRILCKFMTWRSVIGRFQMQIYIQNQMQMHMQIQVQVFLRILNQTMMVIQQLIQISDLRGETDEYAELNTVKSGAAKKEWNVVGGVEVAIGIQDLQKDLKIGSRIAELQTKLEKAILQGQEMTGVLVAGLDTDALKKEVLEYA
ncbi:hypothetical protein L7F22_041259 [Adiantum nelumboides]|nr:hypothetical protein [Adiantum nelumboides]